MNKSGSLKHLLVAASLSLTAALSLSSYAQTFSPTASAEESLDCVSRECLIELVDDYFDALVAHDPGSLPFSDNAYFVENVDHKPIGEGLWQTASKAPSNFKIYIPDQTAGQAGFLGMMEENGEPILIALRIKVMDGRISEVEHVIARNMRAGSLANLATVRPGLLTTTPFGERLPRHELLGIAYSYYDALNLNDGELSPMAADCVRRENGMQTAGPIVKAEAGTPPNFGQMGCTGQLTTGIMGYIDDIDNRRVPIADPVSGLVMGFSHFRHAMINKTIPIYGVEGVTEREVNFNTFDLPAAHVFKVRDGEIHEIEAMGFAAPYNAPSGWE